MDTPTDREPPYKPRQITGEERDAFFARLMKEQNIQPGAWDDRPEACADESTPAGDEPPYRPMPRQMTPEERDAKLAKMMQKQGVRPDWWERLDGACADLWESDAEFEEFMDHLRRIRTEKG